MSQGRQLEKGYVLVNRYLIQECIGMGGMGSVYSARDLHFPNVIKQVAVKEMINTAVDPATSRAVIENFEREANILVTLSHPSIPKIFDYFTFAERFYLVTEFVNGKDLDKLLNETPGFFSESQVVSWAIELCDVLDYLHSHKPEPIIFRDIKPSNIMVNQHNRIVLVDFGIAKAFRGGQRGTMVGTEGYSPPEQYRGEAGIRADIYSLGATLHHMLTRKDPRLEPPFTFSERPICKINPAISSDLEQIVSTALKYNVEERYPSIQVMKEHLIGLTHTTGPFKRADRIAVHANVNLAIKPLWIFKCEDELRGSPAVADGMVYTCAYDTNLYALDASSGRFIWKYPTKGALSGTPLIDKGVVYFTSNDHYLYALDGHNGSLAWTCPAEGPINTSPRIMDNHLFFGCDDGLFYSVDMVATRHAWRVETSGPIWSSAFVTSENLYFGNEEGEVYCLDLRGKVRWKFQAKRAVTASPLLENQVVYFSSLDGQVYALDARSGWVLWRFRMGKGSVSSPVKQNNLIYVGSADGHIYCLDASNAREVWRYKTEHQVSGSPLIYKDALYCGSADGTLYCLAAQTGQLRWKFTTQGPITSTPVIYNDTLYVGSTDHHLYALSI